MTAVLLHINHIRPLPYARVVSPKYIACNSSYLKNSIGNLYSEPSPVNSLIALSLFDASPIKACLCIHKESISTSFAPPLRLEADKAVKDPACHIVDHYSIGIGQYQDRLHYGGGDKYIHIKLFISQPSWLRSLSFSSCRAHTQHRYQAIKPLYVPPLLLLTLL